MCPLYTNTKQLFQPDDLADINQPPDSPTKWIPLGQSTVAFSGDSRFLTSLKVHLTDLKSSENLNLSYLSQSQSHGLDLGADKIDTYDQITQNKIIAALKLLTFRKQHVVVQFWSPRVVGNHLVVLATLDQPFGLGVPNDALCTYRRDSERKFYYLVDGHEEEDRSHVARVFRRGMPEWTTDINYYDVEHFPQQECAKSCNLHGFMGLPVFDSTTGLCVGVLEVLTSSGYIDFTYEVQNIHDAFKTVNLITLHEFDSSALNVPNKHRQNDFNEIYGIIKTICDSHQLPLAQTWTMSQHASFVASEKGIEKSCSSFDTRCVGKVCMCTTGLPFFVGDRGKWPFLKACRERHLDRSCGLVGKALMTRGSCFSGDVTKLGEQEYPLVHDARMNRLAGCFAIFLRSVEADNDCVLEFYLPPEIKIKDSGHVVKLIETLKQKIELASGFELGDTSSIEDFGPPTGLYDVNMTSPDVIQTSSDFMDDNFMLFQIDSLDSETVYQTVYPPVFEMMTPKIAFIDELKDAVDTAGIS